MAHSFDGEQSVSGGPGRPVTDIMQRILRNERIFKDRQLGFHGEFIDSWLYFRYVGAQVLCGTPFIEFADTQGKPYTFLGSVENYDVYDAIYQEHAGGRTLPEVVPGLHRNQALVGKHLVFLPTLCEGDPEKHVADLEVPVMLVPSFDAMKAL